MIMGEYPAGGFPGQGERSVAADSVQVSVRSAEPLGSGTALHDRNCTASRVSTGKSEAVLATSLWLIDQLMTPTSPSLLLTVNRESWGARFRGN